MISSRPAQRHQTRAHLLGGCAVIGLLLPAAALAQNTVQLDEVVVTAGGFEQSLKDAPASVTVISAEDLKKGAFTNLTQALAEVQGLAVTGIANERDIFIRGLPGNYTLILVDGKRVSTRDARPNGSSGYEQSFVPPLQAIERIEVVRGPMSSLYGSDAMGGVINVITKKAEAAWAGSVTVETTLQEHSDNGNSGQLSFNLSGPVVKDKLNLQLWSRVMERAEDRIIAGNQGQRDRNLAARLIWTPAEGHEIQAEAGIITVDTTTTIDRTLARVAVNENEDKKPSDTWQEHNRHYWSLGHTAQIGDATTELSFQQERATRTTDARRQDTADVLRNFRVPEIVNSTLDAKVTLPFQAAGNHTATLGFQYGRAELSDTGHDTTRYQNVSLDQWALYAEDEWRLSDSFAVTGGLRYNGHESYGSNVTPRLYGVWHTNDQLTIKGGVSTGFKAPDIRSVTPGYYMPTQKSWGVIAPNTDLRPETSTSLELAALWNNNNGLSFGATAFQTKFRNKISNGNSNTLFNPNTGASATLPGGSCARGTIAKPTEADPWLEAGYRCLWNSFNIDNAIIRGVELTGAWEVNTNLRLRGNYTFTDSKQETGDYAGYPLARTPRHTAALRADWATPVDGLSTWGTVTYHGSELAAGARIGSAGSDVNIGGVAGKKYAAYTTVDLGGSYAFNERVTLNAAVYNVLDKRTDATEHNAVGEGRRLWLGLTTRF